MPAWPLMRFGNLRRVVCVYAVNRVKYAQTVKGNIKHLRQQSLCGTSWKLKILDSLAKVKGRIFHVTKLSLGF